MNKVLYKGLWIAAFGVVLTMLSAIIVSAETDEALGLPIDKFLDSPVVKESFVDDGVSDVDEGPLVSNNNVKEGGSGIIVLKLDDGSVSYLTQSRVVEHDGRLFRWEKGTVGTFVVTFQGSAYVVTVEDGVGVNIK